MALTLDISTFKNPRSAKAPGRNHAQPILKVGAVNDKYEQEANYVADKDIQLNGQNEPSGGSNGANPIQMAPFIEEGIQMNTEKEELVQMMMGSESLFMSAEVGRGDALPELDSQDHESLLLETPEPEETEFTPRSPEEDPNFQTVIQNAQAVSKHQQRHNPPEAEAASAQAAAPVTSNEVMGAAQAIQVEAMKEQEPNEFDAAGFKTRLMERIAAMQMPKTLEEADNFERHSNINDINQAANQDVDTAQANAAGPIYSATQAEPNPGVVPEREVYDLPEADIGTTPASIGAHSAMPAPRPDSQVSQPLQENMGKVDDVMAENEVTDEMLANSNEASFTGALTQTNEARAHTESAPQGLRAQEGGTLVNAQQNAEYQSNTQLQNMQSDRIGIFGMLANQQNQTATQDSSERTRIASEIDTIYNKAKTDVERILEELETKVSEKFTAASARAKAAFEKHVKMRMTAYKNERYEGVTGSGRWVKDKLLGMPKEVENFFKEGRQVYINHMGKELTVISEYVATQLHAAKDRIAQGRQEVAEYVAELPENLQSIGKESADAIQDQFDGLQDSVNEKQDALIESLAQQYSSALEEVDARIDEMKAENAGLIDVALGAMMGVIETIINLKNMLLNLLAKASQAIGTIISDPIGFLANFFGGIKLGFEQFRANILKHLQAGFLTWLTGAMSGVNLKMPDDIFSLKGIFSLTSQILGLTWDRVRAIGVKVIGEPIIKALEVGFDIVMILKNEGIAGLWEYIKDQFNDLKQTVMDAIMDMIQSQVIQAGIKWILGLLTPVGAFIKACMAIIDVVVFFVQKATSIMELIDAFLDSILAVASGAVGAVADLIENALARSVPVLIGFLASLLGVSGLATRVTKIFQKIQQRVEKAVTKLWVKIKEMGKKVLAKLGIGGKDEHHPEKQKKIDAGFMYLKQQEQQLDNDGNNKLTLEQANQAAQKTKAQHSVFSSMTALVEGDKIVYDYTASPGIKKGSPGEKQAEKSSKVNGYLLNKNKIDDEKNDYVKTENPDDSRIVGHKAKTENSSNVFDGFIVGVADNKYIRKQKRAPNQNEVYEKEFYILEGKTLGDRHAYIQGTESDQTLEDKLESYEKILAEAGETLVRPSEISKSTVDQFRRDMVNLVAGASRYHQKLDKLDSEILHGDLTGEVANSLLGAIFEKWVDLHVSDVGGVEIVFQDGGVLRRADGAAGNSLIEMKSISTGPSKEHIKQMEYYDIVIDQKFIGYLAGSKGDKKVGPFNSIRYYFSNEAAAKLWKKHLNKYLKGKEKIYVGTEKYELGNTKVLNSGIENL